MSTIGRVIGRIRREIKKYVRLRQASREGLVFVEPNFVYRADLSPASVVIDAGCSYEADLSVCLMGRHGVRAFGVDPTRKHAASLRRLEARFPGRFVYVPCAIAASDGALTFHESRVNESGSLFADHVNVIHDDTTSYDVEALTLKSLLKRVGVDGVDLLKLDLEGAEYDVLAGITAEQLGPVRQLFVEFHHHAVSHFNEADTRRLVERVSACGYRTFSVDDHNYLFYRGS